MSVPNAERAIRRVAYFSMEIALEPEIPTYSGGLGILAGDTLRAAADLGVLMAGVTLVHRKGYFRQILDSAGRQSEAPVPWDPASRMELMDATASVVIEGRHVRIRAWCYWMKGFGDQAVPVYLLDTDCPENSDWDRTLTDFLYGGDQRYRLAQEVVLGIGGVKLLRRLGQTDIRVFHMNEGHAALLTIGLLEERLGDFNLGTATDEDIEEVRRQCIFTTHTPVPAGHDQFPRELVSRVLGANRTAVLDVTHCCPGSALNMTFLGLRFSHYINGVAMHHGEVSRGMFPQYPIRAITNGVHAATWSCPAFQSLFDNHIPEWRRDNAYLRYAIGIPTPEIAAAHRVAKRALLEQVRAATGCLALNDNVLTIGFARRATAYKRFDLLFDDIKRLCQISEGPSPMQIIYAGKAHPKDAAGKEQIQRIFKHAAALDSRFLKIVYLEDYGMRWAQLLTSGVDLWLNTPERPLEASGTSGMKAALNGVPSLSILDGWWIEGCLDGTTGWAIGEDGGLLVPREEVESLYSKLTQIATMFYERPHDYHLVMRAAIAINGSFFNSQRMLSQYVTNAYNPRIECQPIVTSDRQENCALV